MYMWQNKLFLPNYLHITERFFLNSFFFCHISKERRKTPEGNNKRPKVQKNLQGMNYRFCVMIKSCLPSRAGRAASRQEYVN